MPLFGAHLSIAGGMTNALDAAASMKMDCVQVFTKNQRQWKTRPLRDDEVDAWRAAVGELGWDGPDGPARVVSHNSYLINLASPDPDMRRKSIDLQREEIERCERLGIPLLVSHPGAHLGDAPPAGTPHTLGVDPTPDERAGLERIVDALDELHRDLAGYRTITCLETTVGSGSNLGYDFAHLAFIRDRVREPERVGFCLDTCHVTAAGYDMTTDRRAAGVLRRWSRICGDSHLRVVHCNDSVGAVGSRRDRHAPIGEGACGMSCFRAILNRRAFRHVPVILETPKGETAKGTPWDVLNLRRLKRLVERVD